MVKKKRGYISFGKFSIDEVLSKSGDFAEKEIFVDDDGNEHLVKMKSMRYRTFKKYGTTCVKCGLEGQYFKLERPVNVEYKTCHFNLYGINEDGEEVMITKDHIVPRAKGGKNYLSNMQPMCMRCNEKKGTMSNEEFLKGDE